MAAFSAEKYLNSLANYEKNTHYSYQQTLKIQRIQDFLKLINNPQKNLRVLHIAGSKGKGSTCAFLAYILRASGFRVGLYTSPHLNNFKERIRILVFGNHQKKSALDFEGMISQKELTALAKELKPLVSQYNRFSKYGALSFFEVYTAMAFLYFKRQKTDFVVLETGMGGRLDATNTADSLVCGITSLSFEHVQKLGKTLTKIATEKAGIIKKFAAIVISASQDNFAQRVISQRCKKFQADFFQVGKQIKYFKHKKTFTIKGLFNTYSNLRIKLLGAHQIANAALAVGMAEALNFHGYNIKAQAIRLGLGNTVWPGRCEVVGKYPWIVLDGAQNLASTKVIKKAVKENFKYRKLILVLGISKDKDIAAICKTLDPLADEIILTRAATSRAASPKKLASYFQKKLHLTKSVKEAKLLAGNLASHKDLVLVTGSLFVVGEFRDV